MKRSNPKSPATRKLKLARETLRRLTASELEVAGAQAGDATETCYTCYPCVTTVA